MIDCHATKTRFLEQIKILLLRVFYDGSPDQISSLNPSSIFPSSLPIYYSSSFTYSFVKRRKGKPTTTTNTKMGYEIPIIAGYTTFLAIFFTAWVGGYLDGLQHSLQDIILGKMGDNRASFGVKSKLFCSPVSFPHLPLFIVLPDLYMIVVSAGWFPPYERYMLIPPPPVRIDEH